MQTAGYLQLGQTHLHTQQRIQNRLAVGVVHAAYACADHKASAF